MSWRATLEEWKNGPGRNEATVPKDKFPGLIKKVFERCKSENVIAGFKKFGIVPLDRHIVLKMMPSISYDSVDNSVGNVSLQR